MVTRTNRIIGNVDNVAIVKFSGLIGEAQAAWEAAWICKVALALL